jgi:hypothetical protein
MSDEFGPTGQFPYGKLNEDDEGELRIGVAADRATETVYIEFGTPVKSLAMRPEQAIALAQSLIKNAQKAKR